MKRALPIGAVLVIVCLARTHASAPVTWEHPARRGTAPQPREAKEAPGTAPAERDGLRADGVSLGEDGLLSLSVPLREIFPGSSKATPPPILWTGVLDPGGNLYVGAGNTGEVLRIDRKGTATEHFDSEELGIRALASGPRGDLFAATFPGGGVYRIQSSGKAEPWFDPEDRYIWALAIDNAENLFVATGERGIVYRVLGQGEGVPLYDSDEAHITALALDRGGGLLAGTAPGGLLYRISPDGRAQTLLDSGLDEISSIATTPEGTIFAAALGEEPPPPPRRPGEKSELTIEVTPAPDGSVLEEEVEQPRKITIDLTELLPTRPGTIEGIAGRIYRLDPGRSPALIWKSDAERVYALSWSKQRGLIFGTGGGGPQGRVYRLEQDGSSTVMHQLPEPQVSALLASPEGRIYACTSNPGRVYLLDTGSNTSGSYLSSVYDAGHLSQWGTIGWEADLPPGTRVEVSTRSGNRPTPDQSWSSWSPPYAFHNGSAISSPRARYLQWKAELSRLKTEASPALRRVRVTLLPENRPPSMRDLAVMQPGAPVPRASAPSAGAATPPAGDRPAEKQKAEPPKGSRWVVWTSSDPDGDELSHTIWIHRPGEEGFRKIADGVAVSPWALSDGDLAEGSYLLRVEADDSRTNGPQRAQSDTETSDPFLVDHTPPRLELRWPAAAAPAGRVTAEVAAADAVGTIARGEYALEGDAPGEWRPLPCKDGICDTSAEGFSIDLPDPGQGRKIAVRVTDAAGNAAAIDVPGGSRKGDR